MNILPLCPLCGNSFAPRTNRQKYCRICIHKPCPTCGKPKDVRAEKCKQCEFVNRIGQPNIKNCRERPPLEQVILEIESLGLLPERQYSFGYIMGVFFGDGCIGNAVQRSKHTCKNGTVITQEKHTLMMRLSVTSQAFAKHFSRQWELLTGRKSKVWETTRTNFDASTLKGMKEEEYSVKLFNVNPVYLSFARYMAHLKYEADLYELLRFPSEVARGFIHGMIDSEGYVNEKYTDIANKRATLLDVIAIMLESLGYKATIYMSPSQKVAHLRTGVIYKKCI